MRVENGKGYTFSLQPIDLQEEIPQERGYVADHPS